MDFPAIVCSFEPRPLPVTGCTLKRITLQSGVRDACRSLIVQMYYTFDRHICETCVQVIYFNLEPINPHPTPPPPHRPPICRVIRHWHSIPRLDGKPWVQCIWYWIQSIFIYINDMLPFPLPLQCYVKRMIATCDHTFSTQCADHAWTLFVVGRAVTTSCVDTS